MRRARRFAWLVMLIADVGLLAWGVMAALAPDYLLGPGSKPILAAGYEGLTGSRLFRMQGSKIAFDLQP
jgi:hypothetical protein